MFLLGSPQYFAIIICLTTAITTSQTVKKKKATTHCMSTYSFTVAETDDMKCSHQEASKSSPDGAATVPRGVASDAMITRRLLAAVHKLVQHNNQLNEAKNAVEMVKKMTETIEHQEDEMKQLVHKMTRLQNQVRLNLFQLFFCIAKGVCMRCSDL